MGSQPHSGVGLGELDPQRPRGHPGKSKGRSVFGLYDSGALLDVSLCKIESRKSPSHEPLCLWVLTQVDQRTARIFWMCERLANPLLAPLLKILENN